MSEFVRFAQLVGMPPEFGAAMPYVRLAPERGSGASGVDAGMDADVTWAADGPNLGSGDGTSRVVVDVSEWSRSGSGLDRRGVMTATFQMPAGRLKACYWAGRESSASSGLGLNDLLFAVSGLKAVAG